MTTREHLEFYARIKGIPDMHQDVSKVLSKVGLDEYSSRMASKLSGGNKRKLSLTIALIGKEKHFELSETHTQSVFNASQAILAP